MVTGLIFRYRFLPARGFEYISGVVRELVGYSPEDFYDDPDLDLRLIYPEDRPAYERMILDPTRSRALRWVGRNDRPIWLLLRGWPITNERGEREAIEGSGRVLSEELGELYRSLDNAPPGQAPRMSLSEREMETLGLAARGWTDSHIGRELGLSTRTIERHMRHIMIKLDVSNRAAAVAAAFGLIFVRSDTTV